MYVVFACRQTSLLFVLWEPPFLTSFHIQPSIISGGRTTMFSLRGWLHCSPPAVESPWQGKKLVQHVSRLRRNVSSLPPSPIPPKCLWAPYAKWEWAKCVWKESCYIAWFRLLQMQTVVVRNLGCIKSIKPQKKNAVPQDKYRHLHLYVAAAVVWLGYRYRGS